MTDFAFRGIKPDGEIETGIISAIDLSQAVQELHGRGITPVEISAHGPTLLMRLNEPFTFFDEPGPRDVQQLLRDLARLLNAGLSVDEALKLLTEMQKKQPFVNCLEEVRETVRQGESLHAAMAAFPRYFPVQTTASIQAGETAGTLTESLQSLANSLDQALSFKERVRAALIYPAILTLMVIATFVLVIGFVLPQFAPLFNGNEDRLPSVTRLVMGFGDFLSNFGWYLLAALGFIVVTTVMGLRDRKRKSDFYSILCRFSFYRRWFLPPEVIRFCRIVGACADSGLPLDKSLSIGIDTVRLPNLEEDLVLLRQEVRRGGLLSQSIESRSWFPALILQFVKVGEQSGELGGMLAEAADILSQEYEARLEKALQVLSPVLTLVMGAVVALLVGAVLLGIMSINNVAF